MEQTPDVEMIGHTGIPKHNPISPAQNEALEILQEECAELIQAASKLKRVGLDFVAANRDNTTSRQQFSRECADVLYLLNECLGAGLIDLETLISAYAAKRARLQKWTKHLGRSPLDPERYPGRFTYTP